MVACCLSPTLVQKNHSSLEHQSLLRQVRWKQQPCQPFALQAEILGVSPHGRFPHKCGVLPSHQKTRHLGFCCVSCHISKANESSLIRLCLEFLCYVPFPFVGKTVRHPTLKRSSGCGHQGQLPPRCHQCYY